MARITPQIVFKHFSIKNFLVYQKVDVPLEKNGLVSILGPNGVGKSSIFSLLEALLYGSTPKNYKRDSLIFNDKDGLLTLDMIRSNIEYTISYGRTKGKWFYKIIEDGRDVTPHTFPDASKKVQTIIGLSQEEFEGSTHLTQNSQHLLISGKPADRRKYIASFFGLDTRYDEIQTRAKEELDVIKTQISSLAGASHTVNMLKEEQKNIVCPTEDEIKDLKFKMNQSKNWVDTLTAEIPALKADLDKSRACANLKSQLPVGFDPTLATTEVAELNSNVAHHRSLISQYNSIVLQRQQAESHNARMAALQKQIDILSASLPPDFDPNSENFLQHYKSLLPRLVAKSSLKAELDSILPKYPSLGNVSLTVLEKRQTQISQEISQRTSSVAVLQSKLNAVKSGKCPTCGSEFESKSLESYANDVALLKEEIEILNSDLVELNDLIKAGTRVEFLNAELNKLSDVPNDIDKHFVEMSIRNLENGVRINRELALTKAGLQPLKEIPTLPDIGSSQSVIQVSESRVAEINRAISCYMSIQNFGSVDDADKISASIADKEKDLALHNQNYLNHSQEHNKKELNLRDYLKITGQIQNLEDQISKLDSLKRQEYYWSKIVEAYGTRGLRVQHLSRIMDEVVNRIPYYASILFEDKSLSFTHVTDETTISIIAKRERLDGNITEEDISCFSGGEAKRMSVVLVLTLADCVESYKRSNLLVLDEVDANLDSSGAYLFVNELLPLIKADYSSAFVISHANEVSQAMVYDQAWTLSNTDKGTKIEMTKL